MRLIFILVELSGALDLLDVAGYSTTRYRNQEQLDYRIEVGK
jgi:hypothetical protein